MNVAQIILLIIGIVMLVASFFVSEKKEELSPELKKEAAEEIRKLVQSEIEIAKAGLTDTAEETVQYAIEKTERALERVTNEKMMAIGEYVNTVLDDINKNHKEVLFVYDMINEKQETIKQTVSEAQGVSQKLKEQMDSMEKVVLPVSDIVEENTEKSEKEETVEKNEKNSEQKASKVTKKNRKSSVETQKENGFETLSMQELVAMGGTVDMPFLGSDEERSNSNEKILSMHRDGKSNMAIAKELGLGIGEVKIVIDLFEGTR